MIYFVYVFIEDGNEEFKVESIVTIDEMKDILLRAIYDNFGSDDFSITDDNEGEYILKTRDINVEDMPLSAITRNLTRLGILDSLEYS